MTKHELREEVMRIVADRWAYRLVRSIVGKKDPEFVRRSNEDIDKLVNRCIAEADAEKGPGQRRIRSGQ